MLFIFVADLLNRLRPPDFVDGGRGMYLLNEPPSHCSFAIAAICR